MTEVWPPPESNGEIVPVDALLATQARLGLRMLYDMVRRTEAPLGYRGWAGRDMDGAQFLYHENALLPLGPQMVDHVMIASAIVLKEQA